MILSLRKIYILSFVPVVAGFIVFGFGKLLGPDLFKGYAMSAFFTIGVFILAASTSLAIPVLIRTVFANSVKDRKNVTKEEFFKFERNLLCVAMITPWFSLIGYLCVFPKFYLAAINLMALYALYYYYPSRKRIDFDKKIFRMKD